MEFELPYPVPQHLAPAIELAVLKARRDFPAERQARERVGAALFGIARVVCKAAAEGQMRPENAHYSLERFLHYLCVHDPANVSHSDSMFYYFAEPVKESVRQSPEWAKYVRRLARLASPRPAGKATTKRADVQAFIFKIGEATGRKITRKDIWSAAGYKEATEFERFQSGKLTKGSAFENLNRILSMEPGTFIEVLTRKIAKR